MNSEDQIMQGQNQPDGVKIDSADYLSRFKSKADLVKYMEK